MYILCLLFIILSLCENITELLSLCRIFQINCGNLTQNSMIHSILTTIENFFILIFANYIRGQNNWLKFLLKKWDEISMNLTSNF